jgi:two-component system chemotaxis sensor kinase CheA
MILEQEAILQTFLAETAENLGFTEEALVTLETNPEDEEALGVVFRAIHTLKGDATAFGFSRVSDLAHAMEDVLDRMRSFALSPTGDVITLLLRCVDALRQMVLAAADGDDEPFPGAEELAGELADLAARADTDAPPPRRGDAPSGARPPEVAGEALWAGGLSHGGAASQAKTLRIDTIKLDQMLNLISEIAVARGRLGKVIETASGAARASLLEEHRAADGLYRDLQELIMRARMVPVEGTFRGYVRVVRDLARESGKLARLAIEASGVEVDTRVIEHIRDPLVHMIRNAIDHGIEPPAERIAQGKEPWGTITLRARHEAAIIVIQVADDGAGMNRARIAARARSMGLAANPEALPDDELFRLTLEPGFSTAEVVSTMSGRGVGMDVVRQNVEAVRGSLRIDSEEGAGTAITIRLPLTLAIIDGFSVGVGDDTYVIPLDYVLECMELPASARGTMDERGVINLRGSAVPYLRLRSAFGLAFEPGSASDEAIRESVVIVHYEGGLVGIAVDVLYGESQTVIKPLGKMLGGVTGISGSAILGDGRVALILDIPSMLRKVLEKGKPRPEAMAHHEGVEA